MKQETLEQIVSKQFQKEFNKEVGKVLVQELKKKEMKQTAVEWLYKNLLENPISNQDVEYNEAVFHNAKEMEKQQIIDAFNVGFKDRGLSFLQGEQYYNKTFKNK